MGAAFTQQPTQTTSGRDTNGQRDYHEFAVSHFFNNDIEKLRTDGFLLTKDGKIVTVTSESTSHMLDMRAAHMNLELGGCYCDLCDVTKIQCLD